MFVKRMITGVRELGYGYTFEVEYSGKSKVDENPFWVSRQICPEV